VNAILLGSWLRRVYSGARGTRGTAPALERH